MADTIPPRGHLADARLTLAADGRFDLAVGTAEFGNGTSTVHQQIAATVLGTLPSRIRLRQSDTDAVEHDTGAYGSTGTVVAGTATLRAAEQLRTMMLERAATLLGVSLSSVTLALEGVVAGSRRLALSELAPLQANGHCDGTPRSVSFNAHGFRVAVRPQTGELRILQSVQRGGRRAGHQPDAVPRADRRWCRAGPGRGVVRGANCGRRGAGQQSHVARLSYSNLR